MRPLTFERYSDRSYVICFTTGCLNAGNFANSINYVRRRGLPFYAKSSTPKIIATRAIALNPWLTEARQVPSPNWDNRPDNAEINLLVIHNISLPPGQFGGGWIEQFFLNQLDQKRHPYFSEIAHLKVSSHFLINREGELVQFVALDKRAWHAGESCFLGQSNCNDFSIGIELEGSDEQDFTREQYDCLCTTTRIIQSRYPAITAERIVGHSDIAPGRKTDPGPCFEWSRYKTMLECSARD